MPKPSELAAQSPATVASLRSVLGVGALEAVVESAAGPTYASIALGEAATTTGQSFAVDNGDGTVSIYLRTGGGSTLQRRLATTAALAADGGTALVGHKAPGTGSVGRSLSAKLADTGISVLDFIPVAEHAAIRAGTSSYDCATGIQAAIDYAIYGGGKAVVFIPAGIYTCSKGLHLGYGTSFNSITIEGEMTRYASESSFCGTAIVFTHNNEPGLSIQGARGSEVRNLSIRGMNYSHVESNGLGTLVSALDDLNAANWVNPVFPAASSSQYAPYAGIAVDPRSGSRPGVSYPDVSYPAAYVGTPAQYGKSFSSAVLLENVVIDGFVVGFANQPCDADGNADFTKLHRVHISKCQYGVSIGNSQSRNFSLLDCIVDGCHTSIVTTKHGRQIGKPSITAINCHFGGVIKWVDIPNTSHGGGPVFIGCYGESIYSIGNIGSGATSGCSTKFLGCEFQFSLQEAKGAPAYILENNGSGFLDLDSCTFIMAEHFAINSWGGSRTLAVRNCYFSTPLVPDGMYAKFALNATGGFTVSGLRTAHPECSYRTNFIWNLETGESISPGWFSRRGAGTRTVCLGVRSEMIGGGESDPMQPASLSSRTTVNKSGKTITVSGRDVTINVGLPDWQFMQWGFGVGDVVWDDETGATFYVKSRTGGTITMRAMTGFDGSGNLLMPFTTTGNLYTQNCRHYSPLFFLKGDLTSGSNTITNCKRPDGYAAFLESEIAVGDCLYVTPSFDAPFGENFSRVAARDNAAGTITLSGTADRTLANFRLAHFVRTEAPNA